MAHFNDLPPAHLVIRQLRDARFANGLQCPRCRSDLVVRWGGFSGRQRYRCQGCQRTFSDLTGSPAAYLKRIELLASYSICMAEAVSVREAARRIGMAPGTAFRWRHRLCAAARPSEQEPFNGFVEVGTIRFVPSMKGSRGLHRPAHKRGANPADRLRGEPMDDVLVMCDRKGSVATHLGEAGSSWNVRAETAIGRPEVQRIELVLSAPHAGSRVRSLKTIQAIHLQQSQVLHLLMLRSSATILRTMDRKRSETPVPLDGATSSPLIHLRTMISYASRFVQWIGRFRGVATRYLTNYLAWHAVVDAPMQRYAAEKTLMRWPLQPVANTS